jgi:hypothetical protein
MLRKFGIIAVLSLMALALAAVPALADNPHFKGTSGPTATDKGTTLNVTGTLAGLGQQGGTIELVAQGNVIVSCTNPSGANQPPGQQPAPTTLSSGVQPIGPVTKSGNFTFSLTTLEPATPVGACKSSPWTTNVEDVQFTSYSIVVKQGGQTTTLGPFTP